jgi:DNA replication protein DnaC
MREITRETCPLHLRQLFDRAFAKWRPDNGTSLPTLKQLESDYAKGAQEVGIPARYFAALLTPVDQNAFPPGVGPVIQQTVDRVMTYMNDDFGRGRALILCGTPGTGKTYCAAAAAGYIHRQNPKAIERLFWKASTLRASLMNLDRRGAIMDSLITSPFLVLDDLGMEFTRDGDFFEATLDAVVDEREANMRPLIITSNLTPERLAAKLGPRAWDRLSGDWGTIKTIVGPSARKSLQSPRPDERAWPGQQPRCRRCRAAIHRHA